MFKENIKNDIKINDINKTEINTTNTTSEDIFDIPELIIQTNENKKKEQHKIIIDNIEIFFPYEPYPNQIIYMEKIIQQFNKKYVNKDLEFQSISALESPTGTGKTLCLLCSTLAWVNTMKRQNKFFGSIIYTTRTHSQISQVIAELKKTCYEPRIAILSSREFSCINTELKNSFTSNVLDIKCAKDHKACNFYKNTEHYSNLELGCIDIEDIIKKGEEKLFCPFYTQRLKAKKGKCDLIFMPYNYIFQNEIRKTMEIKLNHNILIIDEAHNVRQNCEDAKSIEVNFKDLEEMRSDLKEVIKERKKNLDFSNEILEEEEEENEYFKEENNENKLEENSDKYHVNLLRMDYLLKEMNAIERIMNNLKNKKEKIDERNISKKNYVEIEPREFLSIFLISEEEINQIKIIESKKQKTLEDFFKYSNSENKNENDEISQISEFITEKNIRKHICFIEKTINAIMQDYSRRTKLSKFLSILKNINDYLENQEIIKSFVFCISDEKIQTNHNTYKKVIKLNIFCFNPGIGFQDIIKFRPFSIILTSGTLAPFDILENELKIKFDTTLENEHIIDKSQFQFSIIKGIQIHNKNLSFNFEYNNRNNTNTMVFLGITILNLCKAVNSGGILVYFTSFKYLNECYDFWGENNIISKISKIKTIFFDNKENKNIVTDYKNRKDKNSILFSVFRGNSSEGIDFKDDYGRMVICVGVPYANIVEERIQLKKKYLDKIHKENLGNGLTGKKWYINDAISNVNQTLGRVIRHKNDYGVLICIDERYEVYYKNKLFSKWIRDKCDIVNSLDDNFIISLKKFYEKQEKKFNSEKNENIIIKKNNFQVKDERDENENITNIKEKKHESIFDNIFKKTNKEIKYEYNETENKSNDKVNTTNINYIQNSKEVLNDLMNKYINNNNSNKDKKELDLLSKKTKLEINKNNEDINPNEEKTNELKYKNKLSENILILNKKAKLNINKNTKKNEDIDPFDEFNNITYDSKINDLNNKKIKDMIFYLDNNVYTKLSDDIFNCYICNNDSNDNNKEKFYSESKCNHILCNECWARTLYEKLECPFCKSKVRLKTLTKLVKKS